MTLILSGGIEKSEEVKNTTSTTSSIKEALNKLKTPVNTSGVTGNLEYVKMLNNPLLTVRIVPPGGYEVIYGALSGDFGVSLGNKWNPLVPLSSLPLVGDIGQGISGILTATAGAAQLSIESLWMSSATWSGSDMPTFPISMVLLNYTSTADLRSKMLGLAKGALPPALSYDSSKAGAGEAVVSAINSFQENLGSWGKGALGWVGSTLSNFNKPEAEKVNSEEWLSQHAFAQNVATVLDHTSQWAVAAPCYYGLKPDSNSSEAAYKPKPGTTYTLRIGNWFEAPQLLLDKMQVGFSREIAPNGKPLVMKLDATFRPYRNITYPEFAEYFK